MSKAWDAIKAETRLARMRLGQEACEIVVLPGTSDSENPVRVALVPLTDGEYQQTLAVAIAVDVPDTPAGDLLRDEKQKNAILYHACREIDDLSQKVFPGVEEVEELQSHDKNFLFDIYQEMVAEFSPSIAMLTEDMEDDLKKALLAMPLKELSGRQQYALERFIRSVTPIPLLATLPGSTSTLPLTETNDEAEFIGGVEADTTPSIAKSATSP